MDVYASIKREIKQHYIDNDRKKLARISGKVIDTYFSTLFKNLFETGETKLRVRSFRARFYISIKPIYYVGSTMYKNMLISPLNSNYLFEIKMDWSGLKKYKFGFKSMSKLKYFFKKYALDNSRVYKLIEDYEKSIL
jgi:hypothetical protein